MIATAFTAVLTGTSVALLAADVGLTARTWNTHPALVPRQDAITSPVVAWFLRWAGDLLHKRDAAQWEEICYSLAFHLRAGETPAQAVRGVAGEGNSFAHSALLAVAQAYEAGTQMQAALDAQAAVYPELERIASVIAMGSTGGGNIPALLCNTAESLRRHRLERGELRAKLGEARATALLLSLLPWGIGAFTFSEDPSAAWVVLYDSRGRALLMLAAVLWSAGNIAVMLTLRSLMPQNRSRHKRGMGRLT